MQRVSTAIFTVVFLSAMFGGLFHVTSGMDMAGSMPDCPFMTHGETLCSMGVLDHVGLWQATFLAVTPSLIVLLFALVTAVVLLAVAPNLLRKQRFREPLFSKELLQRIYSYSYRPLQELFSSGILHPKLF